MSCFPQVGHVEIWIQATRSVTWHFYERPRSEMNYY